MRRLAAALLAGALATSGALLVPTLSAATSAPHTARAWDPVKGIAVDLSYQSKLSDAQALAIGNELFSMIANKFHANAVSLNFPFYQSGSSATNPQATAITPTPGRLLLLTELARRYHLSVQYRPYLWENNLAKQSRPSIQPSNVAAWFNSYWTFLEPYLETATESGAASFSVALEFTTLLPYLSDWERLVAKAKTVYSGPLFYSQQHVPEETIPLTQRGYDAYQPIDLLACDRVATPTATCLADSDRLVSVPAFTRGFEQNLEMAEQQSAPADLTIEELGIAATSGAYADPNNFVYLKGQRIVRKVQTDWFAGACDAAQRLHLAGLYYWSIDFNTFTPGENSSNQLYNWLGTPTATAIQTCFGKTL